MDAYQCQKCKKMWDGQGVEIPATFKGISGIHKSIHFTFYEVPRCNVCQQDELLAQRVDVEIED